jgi:hypothetical protein
MAIAPATGYFIDTTYEIKYTNRNPVPIPEIIESLKAIEDLIHRTPPFMEKAFGTQVDGIAVYVDTLYSGSLIERFLVRFVFKDEDNYNKAKEVVNGMVDINDALKFLLAATMGGMMAYGALQVIEPGAPSSAISAYNNTITNSIVNIGGQANFTEDDVQELFDNLKDKKGLAKSSINAVKPAKLDSSANIELVELEGLDIDRDFIDQVPSEYSPPVPTEKTEHYDDTRVIIYASDRDKTESSWAGIVPGVVDKRIKFTLAEGVDPVKIHGHTKVIADISVTSRYIKSKKAYEAKSVELANIRFK